MMQVVNIIHLAGWDILQILGMEVLVDWSKHAFVTKFNQIPVSVYDEYTASLAASVKDCFQRNTLHHEQIVAMSRRLGFVAMPLVCLVITHRKTCTDFHHFCVLGHSCSDAIPTAARLWAFALEPCLCAASLCLYICS